MAAAEYDLSIEQGADYSRLLSLFTATGAPFDLTNYTPTAQIRAGQSRTSRLLATFTCTVVGAPSAGQLRIALGAAQTSALPIQGGFYDVFLTNPALPRARKLVKGQANVVPQITG